MPAFAASFAFQPIANVESRGVFAYEALVRGLGGESAAQVLGRIPPADRHEFDHRARLEALRLAAGLGLGARLSLNVAPGSLESIPGSIDELLEQANRVGLSPDLVMLEITESEAIRCPKEFASRLNRCRAAGVRLAVDDFGAGYSGLNLLADFQPDLVKLDMHLVRGIDAAGPRQAIARAVLQVCDDLGIEVIAEGVETLAEYRWLRKTGVGLFQGHLFGVPEFQALPMPQFPELLPTAAAAAAR